MDKLEGKIFKWCSGSSFISKEEFIQEFSKEGWEIKGVIKTDDGPYDSFNIHFYCQRKVKE